MPDFPVIIRDDYGDVVTVDAELDDVTIETDAKCLYFSPDGGERFARAVLDACQEVRGE